MRIARLAEEVELAQPLSPETREQARGALTRAFAEAARMPGNLLCFERLDELVETARQIAANVEALPDGLYDFKGSRAPETHRIDHPIDTTIAGLHVGRGLLDDSDLTEQLAIGLFLQDIGMLGLPPAIVHKREPLNQPERELMMRHPERGLAFLRDERIGALARSVVLSHHERWDGGGYPHGLAGDEISAFARLAAVARAFCDGDVAALRAGSGSALDPALAQAFCDVVAPPG